MLISAIPSAAARPQPTAAAGPGRSQRVRGAAAVLATAALTLGLIAAVLVTVHPLEERVALKSDSASALFENALKSQQSDRAKHTAAEQKLKAQVESSIAYEDGLTEKNSKPLSDSALFKMAYKSQQEDLKKKDAAVAALKQAATKTRTSIPGLPTSKSARLSDAKLFEAALKEQNDERNKDKAALEQDVKAELKRKAVHSYDSLKAQRTKMKAELKYILKADGDDTSLSDKKASKPMLKVKQARTQSLAAVEQHTRHKAATALKEAHKHAPKQGGRQHQLGPGAQKPHTHAELPHAKLPTDSKLYKDALAREGHQPKSVHHSHHKKAQAHAAMKKKKAAQGLDTVAQEKQLVAFLDSAGGSKPRTIKLPHSVENVDKERKKAKAEKAVQESQKKIKTVVKLAAKYRTGRKETYQVGHGWAKSAIEDADHTVKDAKDDWRRDEMARSNAIEASLVGTYILSKVLCVVTLHGKC
jgi:hypothetical protein